MKLPATFVEESENINVIIETPKGCSTKYTYDPVNDIFKLSKILPQGLEFPLHFGFIPYTIGEDGDPLDVLVLLDEPTYPGTLLECNVLGVITAEQTEKNGETIRNDRLIAAAVKSHRYGAYAGIKDLDKYFIDEIINFFVTYNKMNDKEFKALAKKGPDTALRIIKNQMI